MKPIKVLHFICSTGFYGAEKWILALANNCDRNLVTSELVVTKEPSNGDLQLSKDFSALELKSHEIPMSSRFDLRAITGLVKLIKENEIEVLHSHGYKSDILGIAAAKLAGIKSITTPHGFENTTDKKLRMFIAVGCKTFKYFDYVVPLSQELLEDVKSFKVPEQKIAYIQNGVDLKDIVYRPPSENPVNLPLSKNITLPKQKTIGFIGQMIDRKNVGHLLEVFDNLATDNSGLTLVLLGDGDARSKFESQAATLANKDRISFLGFQNKPLDYLKTFDLFVMCSTLEGIPRCLMEAMAMGVPVAAYDIPGVDQLVKHNETGLLAKLDDKPQLEAHCKELLWNEPLANKLSKNAETHINNEFSASRMAREYTALYYDLMQRQAILAN